ncbi:helix-turn-helix domain-containing protein [Scytonema hofmannii]|uniref:helix-turn-helix domain-containing protein n=1 Tax=Scytonema hofmannii TaxID=34078 RepID=UPI00131483D2|nr:helix-turn-helix domain-containing protein [Scytonema hofmannii]
MPPQELIDEFIRQYPGCKRKQVQSVITRTAKSKGVSSKASIGMWTPTDLAKTLGISYERVRSWIRHHDLKVLRREGATWRGNRTFVCRKDFEDFAAENASLLLGIKTSRVRKVIRNKKVVERVLPIASRPRPRDAVIVRLDTGVVYESAKDASRLLNSEVTDKGILYNCSSDKPMINGMNWYRLQYPCFEVPLELKAEFLYYTGQIFYEIYLELCNIDGFTKSCLIVAARNAVRISIGVFKKQCLQASRSQPLTPKQELARTYQSIMLQRIKKLYGRRETDCHRSLLNAIAQRVYNIFYSILKHDSKTRYYAEEFALQLLDEQSQRFFKNEFVPKGYQPSGSLEKADYYQHLFSSTCCARIYNDAGGSIMLYVVKAFHFIKKHLQPGSEYNDALDYHQNNEVPESEELAQVLFELEELNISQELKLLVTQYVSIFLEVQDFEETRTKLGLKSEDEQMIFSVLKKAAMPF